MEKLSRIACGQPDTAVPNTDKWALLNTLTEAAGDLGLNHRTLSVLRALLSFYPERALPCKPGAAVVFPSNATLSTRLNGMPESTLRRHLTTLVRSGIVSRQDSPNRKRFARRFGMAFGFDLSALARAAETLRQTAADVRDRRDRIAALRTRLATVRSRLSERRSLDPHHPLMEAARLILRRKTAPEELTALLDQLEPLLDDPIPPTSFADETSASYIRNERHIQITKKESEVVYRADFTATDEPTLSDVLKNCMEYRVFFPEAPTTWHGILSVAAKLSAMLGISASVYRSAQRTLGIEKAAVTVLCILEQIQKIKSPAAYLRELIKRAEHGAFDFRAMLNRNVKTKLSADNFPGVAKIPQNIVS